jgi:hypothetical protein
MIILRHIIMNIPNQMDFLTTNDYEESIGAGIAQML